MEVESYEHGVPSWIDHSSPDPAKAGEFYSGVFGWDVKEGDPEFGGYTMATKDGRNVAGIVDHDKFRAAIRERYRQLHSRSQR